MNINPLFVFERVSKSFGSLQVLKEVSCIIPKGQKVFILGQSGEGKSVLIKHLVGIFKPDSGQIFFDGQPLPSGRLNQNEDFCQWLPIRQRVGCVFQDGALIDSLTVKENFQIILDEHNIHLEHDQKVDYILDLTRSVQYTGDLDQLVSFLSVGEKKRLGLARALAIFPEVMIYDEPTTSMDPLVANHLDSLLIDVHNRRPGFTSIVISHDIISVKKMADYIIFLFKGRVYFEGLAELFFQSDDPLIKQFRTGACHGPIQ